MFILIYFPSVKNLVKISFFHFIILEYNEITSFDNLFRNSDEALYKNNDCPLQEYL